jgi:Fibronectin type III domain
VKVAGSMRLACALMLVLAALAGCNWGESSHGSSTDAASANSVTLNWTQPTVDTAGNPITGLAGYHVYYGTDQNSLNNVVTVSSASITTCVVEGLKAGTWYFALKSYTASGVESAFTNVASKTIG